MALSSDLISQFVKSTQDKEEPKKESTAYGKIVVKDGKEYVQLDGSELLTPISTTTVVKDEDRVMVTIKNHTAIVTGDLTNPSASNKDVTEIGSKITEFEILIGDKVTTKQLEAEIARIEELRTKELEATNAKIETLEGKVAKIDQIETDMLEVSGKVTANEADITTLRADIADFKDVTADRVDAVEGNFNNLSSDYAKFEETVTTKLTAAEADIKDLETNKLDTETANAKYATIDFSNIGEAAIEKLFSDSGIIKDLIMSDGKVTGELVGVTIKGDIIEGNTVKADKLVILGEDGLYYKLNVDALGETTASSDEKYQNGLDGSAILAESITAEKIAVDDLVAFGATIGGFHINEHAIYSGVKESMTNTTPGMHLSDDGQINIGDSNQFLKYYIDENGNYKLEIQADSIKFGSSGTTIEQYIENAKEPISKTTEGYPLVITDGVKVIDFEIDGKTEQDQTNISPDTPSEIKSVGTLNESGKYDIELVHRGKNLIDVLGYRPKDYTTTISGITYTVLEDGRIKVNGTATAKSVFYIAPDLNIQLKSGIKTISGGSANIGFQVAVNNNGTYVYPTCYGNSSSFTYTNPVIRATCLVVAAGKTINNEIVYLQFEDGDKATDYEQHFMSSVIFELDKPLMKLPSGRKDIARINRSKLYVDRYAGDMVLDGTEGWVLHSTYPHTFSIPLSEVINMHGRGYCTHFKSIDTSKWGVENGIYDAYTRSLYISHLESDTVEEFKTWLSNNNVKLVYELETPITEEVGEVDIPMYKNKTNIYYIGNEVEPDRLYCEYYTLYAERVADLDNDIDEVSASISIEAGKIVEEATDGIISRVTNIEKKQNNIDGELETLTSKVEAAITENDVTILINKELEKGVDKVTTSTGFTFNQAGLHVSKSDSLMETTIDEDGMTINRGDEKRLVANNEGVTAYNLHAKTYLIVGSSSRFEDYIKRTELADGTIEEEPRTGCFWIGDVGGDY